MQVNGSSTASDSVALSKRQQRAQRGNSQGRAVTPELPQPEKRLPVPPVGTIQLINNHEINKIRSLEGRVEALQTENAELVKAHEAAMSALKSKLADVEQEKLRLEQLLAAKNEKETQVTEGLSTGKVVVDDEYVRQPDLTLVSDANPNTKGVPTPTVLDLRQILKDLNPLFTEFRNLHDKINTLRNLVQTLEENGKLSNEDLEKELAPHLKTYSDLNRAAAMTRKSVEDGIARLKKMHANGSFAPVPEAHVKSMSSMNMLPIATIEENVKAFEAAHKDCKKEIDLIDVEYSKVKRRFMNTRDHINGIIARLDTRSQLERYYYKSKPKYEYVTSAMD